MTRKEKIASQKIICEKCGCTHEQQERHIAAFVDRHWQPHASLRFKNWWFQQKEFKDSRQDESGLGISPVVAQNVARIWEDYCHAKEVGAA